MSGVTGRGGPGGLGDDELERALSSGLGRAVGGDVDGDALVRGAFTGARRIRRRRTAVRTAAALVCAAAVLPVGVNMLQQGGLSSGASSVAGGAADTGSSYEAATGAAPESSAAASGGGEAPSLANGPDAQQSTVPQPERGVQASSADGVLPRDGSAVAVPDDALLTADDLGLGRVDLADADKISAIVSTTVLPLCTDPLPGEDRSAGARTAAWATGGEGWQVATVVRVFSGDGAADQFAYLRRTVGVCPSERPVSRETVTGLPGDGVVLASLAPDGSGSVTVVGAVRRGRTTAGVEVVVPPTVGADTEARRALGVERARSLLVRAYARLEGFAAAADADPSLG